MTARDALTIILNLEELKKDTTVTRNVLSSAKLLLSLDEDGEPHVQRLMSEIREVYNSMFASVQNCRLMSTKRDKLCVLFHQFSLEEGFKICSTCDKALKLAAPETFWQLLMEKEFIRMMQSEQETYSASVPDCSPGSTSARHLSCVEENAVRYTAGYVVRKLERKYSHQNTHEGTECSTVLKEMAGKLNTRDSTSYRSEQQSTKWTNLVDRGGIYHVDDIVYELFVALEHLADKELTSIFQASGKGIEKIKKEELSWICNDDDVQFLWCMISPIAIECEEVRQHLLQEIAHLWITTRGHSKA